MVAVAYPQPPPTTGQPARAAKGWWRRNLWGLIVLLPVLALALGPSVKDGLDLYNRMDAHEAVRAGSDGWVTYSGARMRLVDFGPATDLKTYEGTAFEPPGDTKVWRATIAFEAASKDTIKACNLTLEDTEGRLFSANPTEMAGTRTLYPSCTPDDDNAPSPWEIVMYFVTPESARPEAVRISRGLELPRYARLEMS